MKKSYFFTIQQSFLQKSITTILIIISQINLLTAQHVEIYPTNPSPDDCIYIYTKASTSTLAYRTKFEMTEFGNEITIETCFTQSPATAIGTYYDTIAIGHKDEGMYQINYIVSRARHDISCEDAVPTSTQLSFEVNQNSSSEIECNEVEATIYPNPIGENDFVRILASETITRLEVLDSSGKSIKVFFPGGQKYFNSSYWLFPHQGLYFVRINGGIFK